MFHFPAYPRNNKVPCRPMTAGGLPHSEILGSKPCWRLPEAYRILKRPSSVLSAKHPPYALQGGTRPEKPNDSFKRQTTNHHTVKNDHKTIDLETRLIQKRRAWRNRDKANDDITSSHCSRPLSSSQTTTHPDRTRPAARKADGVPPGHPENRTHPKRMRVAVREPKSIPTPLPARPPRTREANDLFHTSTPTRTREPSPAHGPHDGRQTGVLKNSVERR